MPDGGIYYGDPVNRAHPLNRGLVSWWLPLPWYSSGPRLIDIAGKNHGTLTNGPTWMPGPNGFGAVATSGGGYVPVGDITAISGVPAITIVVDALWRSSVGTGANPALFSKSQPGADCDLLFWSGTQVFARIGNSDNEYGIGGAIKFDARQQTAVVFDGGGTGNAERLKLYQDGVPQTLSYTGTILATTGNNSLAANIGRYTFNGATTNATFYSVRLHNRGLSASEVAALYDQARRGYPDTLRYLSTKTYLLGTGAAGGGGLLLKRRRLLAC